MGGTLSLLYIHIISNFIFGGYFDMGGTLSLLYIHIITKLKIVQKIWMLFQGNSAPVNLFSGLIFTISWQFAWCPRLF